MSSITFTPSTGSPITFSGNIVYGTTYFFKRINQIRQECLDGTDVVFDNSVLKGYGTLVLKRLSYDDGSSLHSWIRNTLYMQLYTFTISAIVNVDLGAGKNTIVSGCRLLKDNTDGMFEPVPPGMYNVTIDYSF